jgi:LPXTG-site transpeptidase (sortase) family protein
MDNQNQAQGSAEIINEQKMLALSWNIATEPKLYWELIVNPYSSKTLQIISERFPNTNTIDVIKAVVLAEPEGKYDRNFKLLETIQQTEELRKQSVILTEANERLSHYCKNYAREFSLLSKEFIYESLSIVVFETIDPRIIEQRYSQDQRRNLRLSIIDFVENRHINNAEPPVVTSLSKKSARARPLLKAFFVGFSLILLLFFANSLYRQINSATQPQEIKKQVLAIETQKENQKFPVRLKIPSINVDTAIEYVGVTPKGAMATPSNIANVGWFDLGPRPGEMGNAVIAGHFDGENGEAGVFANLGKLKTGDKLYVEDSKGIATTFIVSGSHAYNPGYADAVFSGTNSAHLNLITCNGAWDEAKQSFSKRLVVFTDAVQ